ncbi:hypothetical protein J7382_00005, partial [Shimia sp. R11_0]|uniref:hypothetical protein n=1 Tax=Shimia sp. R11_0 TaxID=2821096 RepID=UPI001ADD3C78
LLAQPADITSIFPEPSFPNQHSQAPLRPVRPAVVRLSAAGEGGSKVITQNPQALFQTKTTFFQKISKI